MKAAKVIISTCRPVWTRGATVTATEGMGRREAKLNSQSQHRCCWPATDSQISAAQIKDVLPPSTSSLALIRGETLHENNSANTFSRTHRLLHWPPREMLSVGASVGNTWTFERHSGVSQRDIVSLHCCCFVIKSSCCIKRVSLTSLMRIPHHAKGV